MKLSRHPRILVGSAAVLALVALAGALTLQQKQAAADAPQRASSDLQGEARDRNSRNFGVAAHIPPQCYTDTKLPEGKVSNPCYTCHHEGRQPEFVIGDGDLQLEYAFPESARKNPWTNLFVDRSASAAALSDETISRYVATSNYFDADGRIVLADQLENPPKEWDLNGDGEWAGYVPDCHFDFDEEGFDRDSNGAATGWRAFAYYPFPATHWPSATGAMGDVLVRLPERFRTLDGKLDLAVYALNLAIVEAIVKRGDVAIPTTDEKRYGVDLDRDGELGQAQQVTYNWAPREGRYLDYVGDARLNQTSGTAKIAGGLFPRGTEFLQGLRYLDAQQPARGAARFKELRYARKVSFRSYSQLEQLAYAEVKEKDEDPDRVKQVLGDAERGLFNGKGWVLSGFIEDEKGSLRPQTRQETASCVGCHGGIAATSDGMFAFARKLDASFSYRRGWYHWSQKTLEGLNEPKVVRRGGRGAFYEYSYYLMYAGAGDDYRANDEVSERYFDGDQLDSGELEALHGDVSRLLVPSPERALALNKIYKTIVDEQSFIEGRDPLVAPAKHVHQQALEPEQPTGNEVVIHVESAGFDLWRETSAPPAPPIDPELAAQLLGEGISGPDGHAYVADSRGTTLRSDYLATGSQDVHYTFPRRDTLPTRFAIPPGSSSICHSCHRLSGPVVPGDPPIEPIQLPATAPSEPGIELQQLSTDPGEDTGAVWSPDGKHIAWVSKRSGTAQIWLMDADGESKRALTDGKTSNAWPALSPSGDRLAYWSYDPDSKESSVRVVRLDGSGSKTLATAPRGIQGITFHPRGTHLAYAAKGQQGWDVWMVRADGGASPVRLTESPARETTPLWRPGQRHTELAFKHCAAGTYTLCTEKLLVFERGLGHKPVQHDWGADGPNALQARSWTPDGSRLAYTTGMLSAASGDDRLSFHLAIDEVGVEGGALTHELTIPSRGTTLSDRSPVFSPDGRRVAFWAWDRSVRATLWVVDADGKNLRQITKLGFDLFPSWSADGKHLVFESHRAGNADIWVVAL